MKVLLVHNSFDVTGGAEVFYHQVARILRANGHEIAYFSPKTDNPEASSWSSYFPRASEYRSGSLVSRVAGLPRMIYNVEAKSQMRRLIKDFQPDLVHAFAVYVRLSPSVLDAAREANVPVVMSCNDYKHICPNYKLYHHGRICEACIGGRFYQAVVNRCCHDSTAFSVASSLEAYAHAAMDVYRKNVHTFLFASEFMARKTEEFWGKQTFRWRLLRNPFEVPPEPADGPREFVLYFGRMIDEKGVDVLLQAMQLCPEVRLVLVGDGPDRESLMRQAEELGLRDVDFVGAKWGRELGEYLARSRFVVVPSAWHENFPYVILQAFAAGRAVVGSDRGGIPELVKHGERGLVYEASSPEMLARCVLNLWKNESVAREMGRVARKFVETGFSDAVFHDRLIAIYREVVG